MMYKLITILMIFSVIKVYAENIIYDYPIPKNNGEKILHLTNNPHFVADFFNLTNDFEKIEIKENKIFLKRKPIAKKITILGNKSFWSSEIKPITGLMEKQTFDISILDNIPLRIRQFYAENGFLFATVNISTKFDNKNNANITIKIDEGKKTKINDIIFLSDLEISNLDKSNFLKVLNIKKGDVVYFNQLENSIEKLQKFLKQAGYFDAFVVLQDIEQIDYNLANLYILIDFGTRYILTFYGNESFDSNTLNHLTTFIDNGFNYNEFEVSKENIINFYKNKGFLDVEIDTDIKESEETFSDLFPIFTMINFNIKEGKRYKVEEIKINTDDENLKNMLKHFSNDFYNKELLLDQLKKYSEKLYEEGYIANRFDIKEEIENDKLYLEISFSKGKKYLLTQINQIGYFINRKIKLPKVYNPNELLQIQEELRNKVREDGYLDAEVSLILDSKEDNNNIYLNVNFEYQLGEKYKNGVTFIYGSYFLNPDVVEKQFKDRKSFSKDDFDLVLDRLYDSKIFDYINPVIIQDENNKTVNKALLLHDDKRGLLQGSIGYSTDQQFKISLALVLKNLFNLGYELSSYIERSNFQTNYRLSFGNRLHKWGLNSFLSAFEANQYHRYFDFKMSGFDLTFEKKINKWVKTNFKIEKKYNVIDNETIDNPLRNFKTYSFQFSILDDHRNRKINPTSGYYTYLNSKIYTGDIDYQSLETSFRYYKNFFDFITFTQRLTAGYIFKSVYSLPLSERYYLGGISNMRGFAFEELSGKKGVGGNSFILLNNDLILPIYPKFNIYFLTLFDFGNVYTHFEDFKQPSFRKSAGIGLYIPTQIGAFMFNYTKKLDKKPFESGYRLELNLGIDF